MRSGVYKHYKGGLYLVLGVADHSESGEVVVVYVPLTASPGYRLKVRPLTGPGGWNTPTSDGKDRFVFVGTYLSEVDSAKCSLTT